MSENQSEDTGRIDSPSVLVSVPTPEDRQIEIERKNRERPAYYTVREDLTHTPVNNRSSVGMNHSYSVPLKSREQRYSRETEATENPQPLDLGWFRDKPNEIGEIHIRNDEGQFFRNPTPEQQAEADAKVLILHCSDVPVLVIHPGRSVRFQPYAPECEDWEIYCERGTTRYTLTIYPS